MKTVTQTDSLPPMTGYSVTSEETAALALLRSTKLSLLEAAQVACAAARAGRGKMKRAMRCIAAGEEELKRQEHTVTFEKAVEAALAARRHRRSRTLCDFRYVMRRFMKRCPGLARRRVRSITPTECAAYIEAAFDTPRQRQKARLTLSGVFSTAMKRGWCSENPVARVEAPHVVEKTVPILTPEEAKKLVDTAREYKNGICLPAVGLMLYAGIRPHEVARLSWGDVDLEGKRVNIAPQHSPSPSPAAAHLPAAMAAPLASDATERGQEPPDAPLSAGHLPPQLCQLPRRHVPQPARAAAPDGPPQHRFAPHPLSGHPKTGTGQKLLAQTPPPPVARDFSPAPKTNQASNCEPYFPAPNSQL